MIERIVTKNNIKKDLTTLGVSQSNIIFFHSSLSSIGNVEGGAETVIDAFLETIGKSGTLVLPALSAYDWDNMTREEIEKAWDIQNTPTFTGLIPETFRRRIGTIRSDNPTQSVVAFGPYALEITKDHKRARGGEWASNRAKWASNGAFGENSPWHKLHLLDATYMLIGVDFSRCTMLHHVQVILLENYLKKFDNKAPWPKFDFVRMGNKLEELGLVRNGKIGNADTMLMSCRVLVDTALKLLAEDGCECYQRET